MASSLDPDAIPQSFEILLKEMSRVIVGQKEVIEQLFIALLCRGHILLVGVPGLAKTTLIQSFAQCLGLSYKRVQFTPDLMPSDILGTEILQENKSTGHNELIYHRGPVFTHILLADEINRTPPKTQSALLQAMQERAVTVFGNSEKLEEPFMVLATQNPIEQEGTYPLPEAQLDRFLFSILLQYPSEPEELAIVKMHTSFQEFSLNSTVEKNHILQWQKNLLEMTVPDHVYQYAVDIVRASRPQTGSRSTLVDDYVSFGAGPRATTMLILAAKGKALVSGRPLPSTQDVAEVLHPCLNHRILLNFQAEAEKITQKNILDSLTAK